MKEPPISSLHALAQACGIARQWRDVEGREQSVADDTLEAVLAALGHDVISGQVIDEELDQLAAQEADLSPLLVGVAGGSLELPLAPQSAVAVDAEGCEHILSHEGFALTLPEAPGYFDLILGDEETKLAVAPLRCPALPSQARHSGISLQIPSLSGSQPRAFGNLLELAELAEVLGAAGIDALAISPVHALFPGDGQRFSPYSPCSRLHYNALMGDPVLAGLDPLPAEAVEDLIDWSNAVPQRLKALREVFSRLSHAKRAAIRAQCDTDMERQAVFDALYRHFSSKGARSWQDWPERYQNPKSDAVRKVATDNPDQVEFHLFLQWLARESLASVQRQAKDAGMAIGLIGDLAVGVDPRGSDCWALGDAMLQGLTVGAPPDPFSLSGQNWALTSFAPGGLKQTGYAPFITMLRSALGACGGLRIDHAFGLSRLWVIPEGEDAKNGAYLNYPQEDLLNLVTLEAYLADAIIIAEDLGTAPHGFTQAIEDRGMMGMQVLWFQRAEDTGFIGAQDYAPTSVAMTGTHDTPTIAGWWSGRDLDWAEDLGRLPEGTDRAEAESIRDWDRGLLWSTIGDGGERPAPSCLDPVVDAAIAHCAATPAPLAIVPLEDVLGVVEQPNLPGTTNEHPNWRRRIAEPASEIASKPLIENRIAKLADRQS